ncbi:hypothetical protein J6590_008656 [Homalodisca vitripennis]|nr:hypothetical protein J6590_008656 [Homalodisca vitripennis]
MSPWSRSLSLHTSNYFLTHVTSNTYYEHASSVGLESLALTSYYCNTLDLAPRQASVLFGLSNTAGSLSGIISPLLAGFIVTDKSAEQWPIVFYTSSCIALSGALFYGIFGSAERMSWSVEEEQARQNKHVENN